MEIWIPRWLVLLAACPRPPGPLEEASPTPTAAVVVPSPAGIVEEGTWRDQEFPVTLAVPEGWVVQPAPRGGVLRVVYQHVATGTRLEVWAWSDGDPTPRPRAGCWWTFDDAGSYETLRIPGPLRVATCTPSRAGDPRVLGTYAVVDGVAYHLEAIVPDGRLVEALPVVDEVLSSVRFLTVAGGVPSEEPGEEPAP